jgi:hypothetical protein
VQGSGVWHTRQRGRGAVTPTAARRATQRFVHPFALLAAALGLGVSGLQVAPGKAGPRRPALISQLRPASPSCGLLRSFPLTMITNRYDRHIPRETLYGSFGERRKLCLFGCSGGRLRRSRNWIPAFAGMTDQGVRGCALCLRLPSHPVGSAVSRGGVARRPGRVRYRGSRRRLRPADPGACSTRAVG